jgi:hypothetical protein
MITEASMPAIPTKALSLAALCLLSIAFLAAPAASQDPSGVWTGIVSQPGSKSGTYPMRMTLNSASGGSIDYPSLGCGGSLSGGGSAGDYTYTERITYGRERCIDGGTIHLVLSGEQAYWEWTGSGEFASARLRRTSGGPGGGPSTGPGGGQPGGPPVASCRQCGQALLNDVAAGLRKSQELRPYVLEAISKYDNCRANLPAQCTEHCAYTLRSTLPDCDRWTLSEAYRACVHTAHTGTVAYCR